MRVLRASSGELLRTYGGLQYGKADGQFKHPYGVCMSSSGDELIVADTNNYRLQVIRAADGAHVRTRGTTNAGAGDAHFNLPFHVCAQNGEMFVADTSNKRVLVLAE